MASLCAATSLSAAEPAESSASQPAAKKTSDVAQQTPAVAAQAESAKAEPNADASSPANEKFLRMNFRDASLDQVLNYLSEAAGFIINVKPGTSVRGKVTVMSNEALTKDEAVNLLNTVLNENNLAAVENGRTISIMPRDEAKIAGIPVISGADPEKIPITDKIVTQIMPVRFVEAAQLIKDLQPLVSIQTTMTANEAGNSIVMTDTQANIHKVAEIIHDIDMGAEDFTVLKVFPLTHADPVDTVDMLTQLFAEDASRQGGQSGLSTPFFGGGGGRFGRFAALAGGAGGGQNSQNSAQNQRLKKRNRVVAYADQRTASVVVSASRDLMEQIEDVIHDLDGNLKGQKKVWTFDTGDTDPAEMYPILTEVFGKNNQSNNRNAAGSTSALSTRSSQNNSQMGTSSGSSSSSRTSLGQGVRSGGGGGAGFGSQ
jgi:general secretion pathway protein D